MKKQIAVVKAYKDGCVGIRFDIKASGFGPSINVQGNANLTTAEARSLAAEIERAAYAADLKVAKKQAADERRKEWRDREISAGRLKVLSFR